MGIRIRFARAGEKRAALRDKPINKTIHSTNRNWPFCPLQNFAGNFPDTPTNQMKKPGAFEIARRVMDVSRSGISQMQMRLADHVIEPDTSEFDFADFSLAGEIADAGEAANMKMLPDIRAAIDELNQK